MGFRFPCPISFLQDFYMNTKIGNIEKYKSYHNRCTMKIEEALQWINRKYIRIQRLS